MSQSLEVLSPRFGTQNLPRDLTNLQLMFQDLEHTSLIATFLIQENMSSVKAKVMEKESSQLDSEIPLSIPQQK